MNLSITDIFKESNSALILYRETEVKRNIGLRAEGGVIRESHFAILNAQLLHLLHMIAKDGQVSMQQLPGCQAQDITRRYFRILGPTHHSSYLRYQRLSTEWGQYVLTPMTLGCFCLVTPYIKYKLST